MKPRVEFEVFRQTNQAASDLERLVKLLPGVFARDDQDPSGFQPRTGNGTGSRSSDHSDPTYAAANAPRHHDPLHAQIDQMCKNLLVLARTAQQALVTAHHILEDVPTAKRQPTVPDCLACGNLALPRPKSGYCGACYRQWRREGGGDRHAFAARRRASPPEQQ